MESLLVALGHLDAAAFLAVNGWRSPVLDVLMPVLSHKQYAVVPAACVLALVARRGGLRAWLLVLAALLAVGLSDLTAGALKTLLARARPCHALAHVQLLAGCTASLSLPSNHATNMGALAVVGWVGARRLGFVLGILALGVAWSRVYLGVHYPGDVLAGLLVGAGIGLLVAAAALRARPWLARRFPRLRAAENTNARA